MKRRLPPVKAAGGLINPLAFKNMAYTFYSLAGFVTFLGLYTGQCAAVTTDSNDRSYNLVTVLTYIDVSATFVGVDPNFSFYLISIANAGSGFGRLLCGSLSDRFGV